jgi:mRNA interferase MazF
MFLNNNKHIEDRIKKTFEVNKLNINTVHSNNDNKVAVDKINYNNGEIRTPQRMEIWYYNFGNRQGSLQSNIRPILISSNLVNNKFASIRNVFPITTKINKKLPVHVEIDNCGLPEKSLVLTEQITTIDIRYGLMSYVGKVDEMTMKRVDKAVAIQLGDLKEKNTLERLPKNFRDYLIKSFKMIGTYELTIETMKINNVSQIAIDVIEDQKFMEENGLKCYCDRNLVNYNIVYNDYKELMKEKEENIAL